MGKKGKKGKKKKGKPSQKHSEAIKQVPGPGMEGKLQTKGVYDILDEKVRDTLSDIWQEHKTRGDVFCDRNDFDDALDAYTIAVAIALKLSELKMLHETLLCRGILYMKMRNWFDARKDMQNALKIKSASLVALLSTIYMNLRDRDLDRILTDTRVCIKLIQAKSRYRNTSKIREGVKKRMWDVNHLYNALASGMKEIESKIVMHNKHTSLMDISNDNALPHPGKTLLNLLLLKKECTEIMKNVVASKLPLLLLNESEYFENKYVPLTMEKYKPVPQFMTNADMPPVIMGNNIEFSEYCYSHWGKPSPLLSNSEISEILGAKYLKRRMYSDAIEQFSKALMERPTSTYYSSQKAQAYLLLQQFNSANLETSFSIRIRPSTKAYIRRSMTWARMKQYRLAAEDCLYALCFDPASKEAKRRFILSIERLFGASEEEIIIEAATMQLQSELRRMNVALRQLVDSFETSYSQENFEMNLSKLKSLSDKEEDGLKRLTISLCADPTNAEAYEKRATEYWTLNMCEEAISDCHSTLRKSCENRIVNKLLRFHKYFLWNL